jgi:hypothetical protein
VFSDDLQLVIEDTLIFLRSEDSPRSSLSQSFLERLWVYFEYDLYFEKLAECWCI